MSARIRKPASRLCIPLAAALLLALSGCAATKGETAATPEPDKAQVGTTDPVPDSTGMTCNAAAAQGDVGQAASQDVVDLIVKTTGAAAARVIKPGMAVTMDYRQDRVNIEVDAKNMITAVRCG